MFRKFLIFLFFLVFLCVSFISFTLFYLQIEGIPRFFIDTFENYASTRGINLSVKKIKYGIFSGFSAENITLYDSKKPKLPLILLDSFSIHISNNSILEQKLIIDSITVKNLFFNLDLPSHFSLKNLQARNIYLHLAKKRNAYHISSNMFKLNGVEFNLSVNIGTLGTSINLLKKAKKLYENIKNLKKHNILPYKLELSSKKLFNYIPLKTQNTIKKLISLSQRLNFDDRKPVFEISTEIPINNPKAFFLTVPFYFSTLIYDGLLIQEASGIVNLNSKELTLKDISLSIDKDESFTANAIFNIKTQDFKIDFKTSIFPSRVIKILNAKKIKKTFIESFKFTDTPINLKGNTDYNFITNYYSGKIFISGNNVYYKKIFFNKASGIFTFTPGNYLFKNVKGLVNGNIDMSFYAQIMPPKNEVFMYANVTGDPRFIADFINSKPASRGYLATWHPFKWKVGSPPKLNAIMKLEKNIKTKKLDFTLLGQTNMSNVTFNNTDFNFLYSNILLSSTYKKLNLMFFNSSAENSHGKAKANAYLTMTPKRSELAFNAKGIFNPLSLPEIFKLSKNKKIKEQASNSTNSIAFGDNTNVKTSGFIDFKNKKNTSFQMSIDSNSFSYYDLKFDKLNTFVDYTGGTFNIRNILSKLLSGNLTGKINVSENGESSVKIDAYDIDLSKLTEDFKLKKLGGVIDIHLDLKSIPKKGVKYTLLGKGNINIRNANFWSMPFFDGLIRILRSLFPIGSYSKITELKANIIFEQNIIRITSLKTNGRIIAIEGKGLYNLLNKEIDFKLQVKPLKHLLWGTVGTLFAPLSKVFQINLTGKSNKLQWKQLGFFRDIWSSATKKTKNKNSKK